ncbi:MAG: hypothetical protein K2X48_14285 [Chitinophagaceae bacterium]|nr:hypothetical protein [Chitinophagaceae bacterium]
MRQLLIFIFIISFTAVKAQKSRDYPLFVTASPDLIIPNAEFAETHRVGYGASILFGYKLSNNIAPVVSYSYYLVPGINKSVKELSASLLKAGGRFYLGNFYLIGDAGMIFTSGYDNATRFVFGIGGGDEIKLGSRSKLDISAAYESFNTGRNNGIFAVRLGYTFLIGR